MAEPYNYGGVEFPDPEEEKPKPGDPGFIGPVKPPGFEYGNWPKPSPVAPEPVYGPPAPEPSYGEPPGAWEEAPPSDGGESRAPEPGQGEVAGPPSPPRFAYGSWTTPTPQQYTGGYGEPAGAYAEVAGPPSLPPAPERPEYQGVAGRPFFAWTQQQEQQPQYTGGVIPPPEVPYAVAGISPAFNVLAQFGQQFATPQGRAAVERFVQQYGPEVPGEVARQAGEALAPVGRFIGGIGNRVGQAIAQAQQGAPGQLLFGLPPERQDLEKLNQLREATRQSAEQFYRGEDLAQRIRPPWQQPETAETIETFRQQGLLPGAMTLPQRPTELVSRPYLAQAYTSLLTPEQRAEMDAQNQRQQELSAQERQLRLSGDLQGASQVNQQKEAEARAYQERVMARPISERAGRLPTIGYGTTRDIARYENEVNPFVRFGLEMVADPVNLLPFDKVADVIRVASVTDKFAPAYGKIGGIYPILTKGEVAAEAAQDAEKITNSIRRYAPLSYTAETLASRAVTETADITTRLSEAFGNNVDLWKRFVLNPDDPEIVQLTGGLSQSRPFKRAANMIERTWGTVDDATVAAAAERLAKEEAKVVAAEKRAAQLVTGATGKPAGSKAAQRAEEATAKAKQLRDDFTQHVGEAPKAGDVAFDKFTKAMQEAKDETGYSAVAELARQFDDTAKGMYAKPVKQVVNGKEVTTYTFGDKSYPTRAKDFANKWLSMGFMGYNPGYAMRNAANNIVTALSDGANPFQPLDWRNKFWHQVWPQTVRTYRDKLIASGIPNDVAEVWARQVRASMNPKEVRQALYDLLGRNATGAAQTVPDAIKDAAIKAGDQPLADAVEKAVKHPDPVVRQKAVDAIEVANEQVAKTADLAQQVDVIASRKPADLS